MRALAKSEPKLEFSFTKYPWGSDFYHETGRMCPENFLNRVKKHDAILLGAVGRPDIPDHITLNQLLLPLRRGFDLYVNMRPIVLYEGLESPLRGYEPGDIDMLFFRENTEGEYSPIGGRHYEGHPSELAAQITLFTRAGCERIIEAAFEAALKRKKHVTNITKSNAQGHTLVMWDEIFEEVAARPRYKGVETAKYLVDAAALEFVRKPEVFDVVVSTNLFGDILTDLGAAIVGGLGVAASANTNPKGDAPGLFEPRARLGARHHGQGNRQPGGRAVLRRRLDARLSGRGSAPPNGSTARFARIWPRETGRRTWAVAGRRDPSPQTSSRDSS